MAGERIKLEVTERESTGSRESRRLRRAGMIPGVLYGRGAAPHAISVPERDLRRALGGSGGLHTILDVVLAGQKTTHASILKEYQQDPIRGRVTHIDLQEVRLDQPIQASVVVTLVGDSVGVREGGVLSQVSREINVEALPMEIPEHIDLDISAMAIGDSIRLSELTAPEGVTFLDDPEETVLATVTMPRAEEEPETIEEGEEGAAEEGEGEGEAEGGADSTEEPGADAAGDPGTVPG
jgi:large subunit ribosomal protein L25